MASVDAQPRPSTSDTSIRPVAPMSNAIPRSGPTRNPSTADSDRARLDQLLQRARADIHGDSLATQLINMGVRLSEKLSEFDEMLSIVERQRNDLDAEVERRVADALRSERRAAAAEAAERERRIRESMQAQIDLALQRAEEAEQRMEMERRNAQVSAAEAVRREQERFRGEREALEREVADRAATFDELMVSISSQSR